MEKHFSISSTSISEKYLQKPAREKYIFSTVMSFCFLAKFRSASRPEYAGTIGCYEKIYSWTAATAICIAVIFNLATASAAIFYLIGDFDGCELGEVSFDVTINLDLSVEARDSTNGLIINTLSLISSDGLEYICIPGGDRLYFGGLAGGVGGLLPLVDDYLFGIEGFTMAPSLTISDRSSKDPFATIGFPTSSFVNVSAVPLPAALPLLLAGLAGLGGAARRGRRVKATT